MLLSRVSRGIRSVHKMQPIAINDPVAWCVCHVSAMWKNRIKVLFGVETLGDP